MSLLAPPPSPPGVHLGDDDRMRRYRRRMTLIAATLVTLLLTVWVCSFGILPAILAVMVAKHVLVAILLMGTGLNAPRD